MEKNLVVKANKLSEARYRLTVQEQRVILSMISLINPSDIDFKPYVFTVKDFASLVGVTDKDFYGRIKEVTLSLVGRRMTIKESDGDLHISWLSSAKYHDGEGYVELCFDPKLKPYLLALKQEFTRYQLKNTIRLKSVYSVRIYELLKQYQAIGSRFFDLEELRSLLGISDDTFKLYGHFKVKVLDRAQSELKKTDISFKYNPIKTVRRVTGIYFDIFNNETVVKQSYKPKNKAPSLKPSKNDLKQDEKADEKRIQLHKDLDKLSDLYPDLYKKLEKAARDRLSDSDLIKPGSKLTIRFKMGDLLPGFLQKNKLNLTEEAK